MWFIGQDQAEACKSLQKVLSKKARVQIQKSTFSVNIRTPCNPSNPLHYSIIELVIERHSWLGQSSGGAKAGPPRQHDTGSALEFRSDKQLCRLCLCSQVYIALHCTTLHYTAHMIDSKRCRSLRFSGCRQ